MSDLFHEAVPLSYIRRVFEVMQRADWHVFQVLTKRCERAARVAKQLPWPGNVWMGVSVESQEYLARVTSLRRLPASVRFLSVEPLLGPIPFLPLKGIHWVILGGESGPRARPIQRQWVRAIRDRCLTKGVPFFFKQWGGVHKATAGRVLDGRVWDEMPAIAGRSTDTAIRLGA
jgi:protein gp37